MKTVAGRLDLGFTRTEGYTLFDEASKEFQETTPKEVKNLINSGQVNGLRLVDGKIELDTEGFNISNLMIKSGVSKFRPLYPTNSIINVMHSVVRVIETDNGRIYETISNKYARVKINAERLKMLMEVGNVGGVRSGKNGKIEICKGVSIEDKRTKVNTLEEISQTVVEESEQSLIDDNAKNIHNSSINDKQNLQLKQGSADTNTEVKIVESKNNETITSVEKSNNLATSSGGTNNTAAPDNFGRTSNDTLIVHDNVEQNNKNGHPKKQVSEKKLTTNRNTNKK
jgi:hypothetical protein